MGVSTGAQPRLVTHALLSPRTLLYFYRRRLRAHGVQELLAGVGIAAAVALVLAAAVTQGSIAGSTRQVLRAVIGPAQLQLRARGPEGFSEAMLARVEALPGVQRAAPLLERSVRIVGPGGRSANVYLAGTDVSLAVLNGLGRTLPLGALSTGAIGLSAASARALHLGAQAGDGRTSVTLLVGGVRRSIRVSAVLGDDEAGVLAQALVGVTPLASMQSLFAQPGRITRILVQVAPAAKAKVARELRALAGGRLIAADSEQDIALLEEALHPSAQASALFAAIGALLGFLFAFNAILLTVPERRRAIADLRMAGTRRSAIVQMVGFQAVCLGTAASLVALALGYALSRWVFHESTSYLAQAFALSGGTVVGARTVLLAGLGGVLMTCLASALPLADLRRGRPRDAIYFEDAAPGQALAGRGQRWLFALALAMLALASVLYAAVPSGALVASVALALATVLAVPVAFAGVLAGARWLSAHAPRMATLALAIGGVRATTLRSLALAATGAVALFGSVALGGARANLLDGIRSFAHSYAADAPIWVSEPDDNQATRQLAGDGGGATRIAQLPGVASVERFQGTFLTFGPRRVWIIARPPGGARTVLATQTLGGSAAAARADARLAQGGWIAVSQQIAAEDHARVGGTLTLPTPSGYVRYRVAALTSNLAWSPGVVFMSTRDFSRAWGIAAPSALAVRPARAAETQRVKTEIVRALGPTSGLEVATASTRQGRIDALTSEGLSQLGLISTLLVITAIVALGAALASSINQRRGALAGLRLTGAQPARLRRILLIEGSLMLGAGCVTGALAGVYGQFVIDAYLRHVTGFPVAAAGASARPLEILALVLAAAFALVAIPGWLASRVSPALALADE
jgi:putative ABC transport system permease protein